MNLSHLYYFKKLVEVKHYTKAAQELYIAQPTLSAAISALEKELGAPLFQKKTRAVKLTPYGQDFYRYVNMALQNLDKGVDLVEQRAGLRRMTVRIGAIYAVQDVEWARNMKEFRASAPTAVTLDIRQDRTHALLKGLESGLYDVVFVGTKSDDPNLISIPFRSFDLRLAVNEEHPLARRTSVSLSQLRPYHLLSYGSRSSVFSELQERFERNELDPDLSYSDGITMCSMVEADPSLIALVVQSFLLQAFDHLSFVKVDTLDKGFHKAYLTYRDDEYSPDIVKSFVRFFTERAPLRRSVDRLEATAPKG
ncbi:MAG: LysR substrate-binding domain-containing protein [Eggerthellaceae bacterium]|jgi:DNA-binding transcriptional LysR family regulator